MIYRPFQKKNSTKDLFHFINEALTKLHFSLLNRIFYFQWLRVKVDLKYNEKGRCSCLPILSSDEHYNIWPCWFYLSRREREISFVWFHQNMESKRPYFAAIVSQIIFSGMSLLSKAAFASGMNTYVFLFYRQAFGSLFLLPLTIFFKRY